MECGPSRVSESGRVKQRGPISIFYWLLPLFVVSWFSLSRVRGTRESPGVETPSRSSCVAATDFPMQRHAWYSRQFSTFEFASAIAVHSRQARLGRLEDQLPRIAFCGGRQARPSIVGWSSFTCTSIAIWTCCVDSFQLDDFYFLLKSFTGEGTHIPQDFEI
jgi:hypothetical protein